MSQQPYSVQHFLQNEWIPSDSNHQQIVHHAIHGTPYASVSTKAIDSNAVLEFARVEGNARLRKMTFQERGRMIKALALHLHSKKELFYEVSWRDCLGLF